VYLGNAAGLRVNLTRVPELLPPTRAALRSRCPEGDALG
jgi:hypothetical protein